MAQPQNPNGFDFFRRGEPLRGLFGKVASYGLDYFRRGEPVGQLLSVTITALPSSAVITATAGTLSAVVTAHPSSAVISLVASGPVEVEVTHLASAVTHLIAGSPVSVVNPHPAHGTVTLHADGPACSITTHADSASALTQADAHDPIIGFVSYPSTAVIGMIADAPAIESGPAVHTVARSSFLYKIKAPRYAPFPWRPKAAQQGDREDEDSLLGLLS